MNAGIGAAGKSALSFQFPIVWGRSIPPKKKTKEPKSRRRWFPSVKLLWGFGLNHCIICQNHFNIHIKQSSLTKGPEKHGTYNRQLGINKVRDLKSGGCKDFLLRPRPRWKKQQKVMIISGGCPPRVTWLVCIPALYVVLGSSFWGGEAQKSWGAGDRLKPTANRLKSWKELHQQI